MKKILFLPFYVFYKIILIYSKILKFFGFNDYLKYSNLFLNHIFQLTNSIKINNKKSFNMTLHTPELRTLGRLNSIFTKSPITMNWLNKLDNETILYDFGSNIGLYSIYHCILNDGYSYSFEAHHLNLFNQIQNINKNNLQNKIKIIPNFFSSNTKIDNVKLKKNTNFGSSDLRSEELQNQNEYNYKSLFLKLDDLLDQRLIQIPDYIKIDVDGHEMEVLKGMEKVFENQKLKSVIIEVEKNNRKEIDSFFKKNNFYQNMDMFSENDNNLIYERKIIV